MTHTATTSAPSASIEHLPVGSLTCDFIQADAFKELCSEWLKSARFHHVVTLNPEMVMEAEENKQFREAAAAAEIRVPDGAGLVWAHWFIRSQFWSLWPSLMAFPFRAVERITGIDTVDLLAKLCAKEGLPMYLLGGTLQQVERTAKKLKEQYPNLTVHTSPDHQYDAAGPASIIADIQSKQPAVLLVAYGARKQTVWIEKHRQQFPSVRIAVGVGGAFAILSEDTPRAPEFFRRRNAEWLWRLILEPTRLPRIWRATVKFPLLIHRQKMAHPPTFSTTPTTTGT